MDLPSTSICKVRKNIEKIINKYNRYLMDKLLVISNYYKYYYYYCYYYYYHYYYYIYFYIYFYDYYFPNYLIKPLNNCIYTNQH